MTLDQRFDEEFVEKKGGGIWPDTEVSDVKAFIHSEIKKALEEMKVNVIARCVCSTTGFDRVDGMVISEIMQEWIIEWEADNK